jgi:hypothetical protein
MGVLNIVINGFTISAVRLGRGLEKNNNPCFHQCSGECKIKDKALEV